MVLGFNTGINTGANALNSTGISNKTYRVNVNTYNPRYPGFDEEDYKKLERLANSKGVTGSAKTNLMDELYQYYYPQVSNSHKLDERQVELNQAAYQNDGKEPGNTNIKLTSISQQAKQRYGISATVPDDQLLDSIVKGTPNGQKLLEDYINNGNPEFLYVAGIQDRPKEEDKKTTLGQVATDIVGGAYDSVTGAGRFLAKGTADVIGWTAKQLGADEDKVNSLVQSYKDSLKDFSGEAIGADTDSVSYNVTKGVGDIAQVMAGEGLIKSALQGTTKGAALLNYMKNAPTWKKMVAGGLEGAGDMTLYSIVADSELPSFEEAGVGAAIGAAIPGGARLYGAVKPSIQKHMQKAASQLELSGLLNPAKLNTIKNQLINEGTDLAKAGLKGGEAEDVGKWMMDRGFKGDKATIINNLGEYAKKSHSLKREVLGASESLHSVDSANKSLEIIHNTIDGVPGLEKRLARVEELMGKEKHTLAELDEIKSILDDTVSIYTNAGDVRAGAVKDGLDKVRKDLRKYIEDAAEKEGLGNVKMLNNETQIAKGLQDGISRKDSADAAREMLSVFSKSAIGGAAGYNVGPFDNDTLGGKLGNIAVGALAGKYLFSTKAKTELAGLINKMSGSSKKELERFVAGDLAAKKLSNKTKKELLNVFEEAGITSVKPTNEMTAEEMNALLKKYSYGDVPALEFKEGADDAGKTVIPGGEKIAVTPEGYAVREGKIGELPTENINYVDNAAGQTKGINEGISKTTISEDVSDLLPLNERVGGDDLLNAEDLIDEVKSVGAKVDENGYVTVYHQTTPEAAEQIIKTGKMSGKENGIFFSTSKDATQAEGRGAVKIELKIPAEKLQLDDIFTNNADVKILSKPGEEIDIGRYLVKNDNINPVVNEKTGETLSEAIEKLKNQGWDEESINKYKDAILAQSKGETYKAPAKTLDDLIEPFKGNIKEVYHGTKSESADKILKEGFKYGSELPENSYRGGGYDAIQDVVSFSTSKKNADVFSKVSGKGTTLLSKIKKGANIVKMKGIEYAEELSEYLPELKKRGIDGVILDNGENEFVVINKNIIGKTSKATK